MWDHSVILFAVLAYVHAAPQFVTFNEGKLGVNFGGYHAAVGIGGLLGSNKGAGGGLFAEAGTPHGQSARAGLGGSVDAAGGSSGGLYAGATAGGNVKAAAGLGGEVTAGGSSGGGFASASAGKHSTSTSLGGATIVKETEVVATPVEKVSKKIYTDVTYEAANEIIPAPKVDLEAKVNVKAETQPAVIVKEVYVEPPPTRVFQKTIIKTRKPHRHHLRKTAYIGGYIEGGAGAAAAQPAVKEYVQPIERRSDVDVKANVYAAAGTNVNANAGHEGAGEVSYTKKITVQRNPTFFQDIFNIPIATLKAVNSFLTNTAGSTSVSVQKSASVQADSDLVSSKHAPVSKTVASEAHISVQTPSATKFIDDIFSIPINTLSAVNTFLENNVGRKKVEITGELSNEPTKVRLGPHARRRANKQVTIIEETEASPQETH